MRQGVIKEVHDGGQRLIVQFDGLPDVTEVRLSLGRSKLERPYVGQVIRQEPQGHVTYGVSPLHFNQEDGCGPDH